jgi:hypothetical protein
MMDKILVMPQLSGGCWVGEALASLPKGRLKSPLPRLSEGLQILVIPVMGTLRG